MKSIYTYEIFIVIDIDNKPYSANFHLTRCLKVQTCRQYKGVLQQSQLVVSPSPQFFFPLSPPYIQYNSPIEISS